MSQNSEESESASQTSSSNTKTNKKTQNTPRLNPQTQTEQITTEQTVNLLNADNSGSIAVRCWNCKNISLIKNHWSLIQCPICHKMNKIPQKENELSEILKYLRANTLISYADKERKVPLVNYLVVCPYCKTDNKVRETAYYCICYRCKNKWSLGKKTEEEGNPPTTPTKEGNYYKYDSKTGAIVPPDKPLRFSDLFFPDPTFYPGYYPINSISPLYPEYFNPYDDYRYMERQRKMMKYGMRIRDEGEKLTNHTNIDKYQVMSKLKELDNKVDKLIGDKIILTPPKGSLDKGYGRSTPGSQNNFDKTKSYENLFFLKK